jgi:hypothetical protein
LQNGERQNAPGAEADRGCVKRRRLQIPVSNYDLWGSTRLQRHAVNVHDAAAIFRTNWPIIERLAHQSLAASDQGDIRLETAGVDKNQSFR